MKKAIGAILGSLLLATFLPIGVVHAQTFTDQSAWEATICNPIQVEDFSGYGFVDGGEITTPFPLNFGYSLGQFGLTNVLGTFVDGSDSGLFYTDLDADYHASWIIFETDLEGIGFVYDGVELDEFGDPVPMGDGLNLQIYFMDGSSDLFLAAPSTEDPSFFGWHNDTGKAIDTIKLEIYGSDNGGANGTVSTMHLHSIHIALGVPMCENTPRMELASVSADLATLLPTGNGIADQYIETSILFLDVAQDDLFWQEDGRLSNYGLYALNYIDIASYYIEVIHGSSVIDDAVDRIQDLTAEIVATELEYALDHHGTAYEYLLADYYADYAQLYSDYGYYGEAFYLWRKAWYFARLSTL